MSKRVESRLPADVRYTAEPRASISAPRGVLIKGLHQSASIRGAVTLTEVSDDDAEFLAAHPHFIEHQQRGFVKIV